MYPEYMHREYNDPKLSLIQVLNNSNRPVRFY
jgi:hypothetical protein